MLMVELSPSVDVAYPSAFDFLLIMIHFYTENTIISAGTYLGGGARGNAPFLFLLYGKMTFCCCNLGQGDGALRGRERAKVILFIRKNHLFCNFGQGEKGGAEFQSAPLPLFIILDTCHRTHYQCYPHQPEYMPKQ